MGLILNPDDTSYQALDSQSGDFDSNAFESAEGETGVDVSEGEVEAMDDSGNTFVVTPGFSFSAAQMERGRVQPS